MVSNKKPCLVVVPNKTTELVDKLRMTPVCEHTAYLKLSPKT
jgi:hypothetical protein